MKPSKSPENTELTPSKKKLKQARLPFKLISETSPTPVVPPTRKRKLSAADAETVPKIGKLSKENDLVDNAVVISDEETIPEKSAKEEKPQNPFVKLVDTAWKKKLQKNKKKKTVKKSKIVLNGSTETVNNENESKNDHGVEKMEVDLPAQEVKDHSEQISNDVGAKASPKRTRKATPNKKAVKKSRPAPKSRASPRNASKSNPDSNLSTEEIVVLEDSNPSDEPSNLKASKPEGDSVSSAIKDNENCEIEEKTISTDNEVETASGISSPEVVKQDIHNISSSDENEEDEKSKGVPEKDKPDERTENPDDEAPGLVTPIRSTRNKAKADEKELSMNKSKADESMCSNPVTPKQNKSLSATTSLDDSLNESTVANLTPKQLAKRLEAAKKLEERNKEKLDREKKKQQEKEERAKQRQEKEDQKKKEREEKEEAKRREKEEKEEQRRKEKEEKEKQKELEKKLREEKEEQKKKEKEEKEEQRKKEKEAREEEKRKKQEALELEKQEQELKKKKAAEAFVNFFVPKQKSEKDQVTAGPVSKSSVLSSFAIKSDMRLAPTIRVDLSDEQKESLDNLMEEQNLKKSGLYLGKLKDGATKPLFSGKTWPLSDKDDDDDVLIVEDELPVLHGACEEVTLEPTVREKLRPKLFSFHENRRPPYWGTWRKKSANITPRRPFGQDKKNLDYEVDSDEEWEEEPEGESVDGSAAGSDAEEDADEYEVDNEVFVPHGYLSDEEATMDDDDVLSLSPETQKARLKHLEDEFESEMKKPTEKLKPRLYGILWENKDGGKPDNCVDALWNYFGKLSMIMNDPTPFLQPSNEPEEGEKKKVKKKKVVNEGETPSPKSDKKKKTKADNKESKPKNDPKKNTPEVKNQPGINSFLTKLKST